ncbi:methylmalonyl-CoA mutase family protein [Puia dinghuensis]|uniref:Fused isobutyryl-CoA mutase n=1 Tax=Puia dinghuensis TaxID=1792502 RepID=A0A8J2XUU9_9BACT|nr:methylmalonyl-CoA mutase family protein [Puia dinghuensis]GGB08968.1 Fused isobutyryl-CoA mutase [Puia dinghuensis]
MSYTPVNKVRLVTAAALFDGHDAAINIMRRILQAKGAEIIHLGHNRSVAEIVECAIEEDVQGIAITSYQGGHLEFFKYMKDLLDENGCGHIRLFGGGGGTILPQEIEELHQYGITRIYSPDDGRRMGLEGMIEDVIRQCDFPLNGDPRNFPGQMKLGEWKDIRKIARSITNAENGVGPTEIGGAAGVKAVGAGGAAVAGAQGGHVASIPVVGVTGTGGAGKSSVTDELVRRYLNSFPDKTIAVVSVDPSKKKTGGALLGDRIRMNAISSPRAYMRSLATRDSDKALSAHVQEAIDICKSAAYDLIILESAGVGQSDASILDHSDISLYVMTPEYGAASQLEKINMLDYADLVVLNKFDKAGALDALHDIRKQYKRNHQLWTAKDGELPVVGTIAAQFNDAGVNELFEKLMFAIETKTGVRYGELTMHPHTQDTTTRSQILPASRVRYMAEITGAIREYNRRTEEQADIASRLYRLSGVLDELPAAFPGRDELLAQKTKYEQQLFPLCKKLIEEWPALTARYRQDSFDYDVRGKVISQPLFTESLSGTAIPRIAVPRLRDWGDILRWRLQENFPGKYPYTAGVFPLKRAEEDPTRMFAGEGGPERTNKRFHYVSAGQPAKRLSTAFDSVTLYGEDPDYRPDIYGKIGNAGVSIATVDDAKKLYSGFDLCDPKTSVSMTINGPAPILLAFFMNAAIDQQCEKWLAANGRGAAGASGIGDIEAVAEVFTRKYPDGNRPVYRNPLSPEGLPEGNDGLGLGLLGLSGDEVVPAEVYQQLRASALSQVRGTVQADILKEDQAQNTCIFSTEFALRLMGDVQAWFISHQVRNFYSVSISGYHIAEAGANPITQLAFTLSNGFTYVEYYLSRGMAIDDFAPNLSFFFSNGMDPEYSVIGRVARRIWAKAIKHVYKGNGRSQKLKYHIQTSGRSLHAQEIDFNDIRTTLQALYAIYDNCNSLHTNAYDEAITTPTEESVRRAMAIQLIINRELGSARTENYLQGSFAVEELTDLVEEAVLSEFDRINERGGVLGAMERMYQRNKIQEESLHYESLKHSGELPIVGVNTFLDRKGSPTVLPGEVIRSTAEEKDQQIGNLQAFRQRNTARKPEMLRRLKEVAVTNGNLFGELMETVKYCTLGEITNALYEVGGQYRRNM